MGFKENLLKKMDVDRLAAKVAASVRASGGCRVLLKYPAHLLKSWSIDRV